MRYFNTTFRLSMVPDGTYIVKVKTIDEEAAAEFLRHEGVVNAVNPNYANTLGAIFRRLGVDVRQAKGGGLHSKSVTKYWLSKSGIFRTKHGTSQMRRSPRQLSIFAL
jgi:hypothetical protein